MPDHKVTDLSQADEKPKESQIEEKEGEAKGAEATGLKPTEPPLGEKAEVSAPTASAEAKAEAEMIPIVEPEAPAPKKSGAFFNETLYNALKEEKRGLIAEIEALQKERRQMQERLREEESEKREINDRYLRLHADFDNFRRRWQRDKEEQKKFGHEGMIKDFLSVLDNFDLAIKSLESAPPSIAEGIHMVYRQCLDSLSNHGVKRFDPQGEAYDYTKHEAISLVETEEIPSDTVHQVFRAGYVLHDRLLRPALVTVARRPSKPASKSTVVSAVSEASSPSTEAASSEDHASKPPESTTETPN